jgi:hypothetical protein
MAVQTISLLSSGVFHKTCGRAMREACSAGLLALCGRLSGARPGTQQGFLRDLAANG